MRPIRIQRWRKDDPGAWGGLTSLAQKSTAGALPRLWALGSLLDRPFSGIMDR
jgi:hypothetical protein